MCLNIYSKLPTTVVIKMNNDIDINVRIRKSHRQNNINSTDGITGIPQTELQKFCRQ